MKKNRMFLIIIAGAVVVAGGLIFGVTTIIKKINTKPVYYTVTKEIYENVIEISGTVEAAQEQTLQALSDGTVMAVYVKEGDVVKKGDVILQLDDTTEKYNLAKQDYTIATASITGSARELSLLRTERLALVQKVADRQVVALLMELLQNLMLL